jgi:hypothetical protein
MKLIPPMELKVLMCSSSFESTLFLVSHDVDVIRPELCSVECIMDLKTAKKRSLFIDSSLSNQSICHKI